MSDGLPLLAVDADGGDVGPPPRHPSSSGDDPAESTVNTVTIGHVPVSSVSVGRHSRTRRFLGSGGGGGTTTTGADKLENGSAAANRTHTSAGGSRPTVAAGGDADALKNTSRYPCHHERQHASQNGGDRDVAAFIGKRERASFGG